MRQRQRPVELAQGNKFSICWSRSWERKNSSVAATIPLIEVSIRNIISGITTEGLRDDAWICNERAESCQPPLPSIPTTLICFQGLITSHLKPLHKPPDCSFCLQSFPIPFCLQSCPIHHLSAKAHIIWGCLQLVDILDSPRRLRSNHLNFALKTSHNPTLTLKLPFCFWIIHSCLWPRNWQCSHSLSVLCIFCKWSLLIWLLLPTGTPLATAIGKLLYLSWSHSMPSLVWSLPLVMSRKREFF